MKRLGLLLLFLTIAGCNASGSESSEYAVTGVMLQRDHTKYEVCQILRGEPTCAKATPAFYRNVLSRHVAALSDGSPDWAATLLPDLDACSILVAEGTSIICDGGSWAMGEHLGYMSHGQNIAISLPIVDMPASLVGLSRPQPVELCMQLKRHHAILAKAAAYQGFNRRTEPNSAKLCRPVWGTETIPVSDIPDGQ